MPVAQTKIFKVGIAPLVFVSCWLVMMESPRSTALVLLVALVASYVRFLWSGRTRWMRLIFVAFLIATLLPIDVSLRNYPGPPRFVPLIMGSPTDEDAAREERGEVVVGGCILRGNDPRWVLVW